MPEQLRDDDNAHFKFKTDIWEAQFNFQFKQEKTVLISPSLLSAI